MKNELLEFPPKEAGSRIKKISEEVSGSICNQISCPWNRVFVRLFFIVVFWFEKSSCWVRLAQRKFFIILGAEKLGSPFESMEDYAKNSQKDARIEMFRWVFVQVFWSGIIKIPAFFFPQWYLLCSTCFLNSASLSFGLLSECLNLIKSD